MDNSTTTRLPSRRRIFFILLFIAIFLALPSICRFTDNVFPRYGHLAIESVIELERVHRELPLAEARWQAHSITDYEIDARAIVQPIFCHNPSDMTFAPWDLEIRQDKLLFDNDIQKNYVEECSIGAFLPPKVFDTIRQRMETANPLQDYLRVDFDPVYGYVSKYYSDYVWYPGTRCADCLTEYIFSNFRPKKP
jgi:hypothetical protein